MIYYVVRGYEEAMRDFDEHTHGVATHHTGLLRRSAPRDSTRFPEKFVP
jgi:hypothetical protein